MRDRPGLGSGGTGRPQMASIKVTFKLRRRMRKLTRVTESVLHRTNSLCKGPDGEE